MRLLPLCSIVLYCVAGNISLTAQKTGTYFNPKAKSSEYLANTIIVKVKQGYRSQCDNTNINIPALSQYFKQLGSYTIAKKYPNIAPPQEKYDKYGRKYADLSLIYEIKYSNTISLQKTINQLFGLGYFEYVQPHYIPHFDFTPNDANYASQYNITQIKADSAWNVDQGDSTVVIGIVDTGTELTHSDLKDNIRYNYGDPINGIDDDHDGYIDNFRGWDVAMNDDDPTWQGNAHGVHVCGIAAASTNNGIGIAGVGFKCRFLPVKIANATGVLTAAYEGITYAANHGCSVINCSWGGTSGGPYGQDVVTYATINKNALVVAAAGNDGQNELFYPACYQNVLSVASTNNADVKSGFSNYGYNVGLCAPGENIYSTWSGNSYTTLSGTSMASPCAAGAAAIVKNHFPTYNASQIAQRLIVTCDNIDAVNPSFVTLLGGGRINLYRAITAPVARSITMTYDSIVDNNNNIFVTGDTLRIRGIFTNFLDSLNNVKATLSSTSPYVTITNNTVMLGAMATMSTANNFGNPFTVKISSSSPINQTVTFELTFTDGAYVTHQYFNVVINVDYLNITINDINTTVNSSGLIGYDGPNQTGGGLGFTYNGSQTLLSEGGLMIGYDSAHVSDYIRNLSTNDADFQSMVNVHQILPPKVSNFDLDGYFNDAISTTPAPLPVKVHHQAFAWDTPGNLKYVVVQYTIYNTGATAINNLYAGIFADWDITSATYNQDRCFYDAPYRMGYAYYSGGGQPYVGISVISTTAPAINYSIDNDPTGGGGVIIYNGYSTAQKYYTMSHSRNSAGVSGSGNDIVDVVSSGPFNLNPGDSAKVTFALVAGDSLKDIETSADSAAAKFGTVLTTTAEMDNTSVMMWQNFPNPATESTTISFRIPKEENSDLSIYNLFGEKVLTLANGSLHPGMHQYIVNTANLAAGIYFYRLNCESGTFVRKMIIVK
jgi:serine protease